MDDGIGYSGRAADGRGVVGLGRAGLWQDGWDGIVRAAARRGQHGPENPTPHPAIRPARLLRRRGPRHPRGGGGDPPLRRARLRPSRDRPQPHRGGGAGGAGRRVRRGAGRGAGRRARGVLRPRRAQIRAGRGRAAAPALLRRDLPAGQQGAPRGGAPLRRWRTGPAPHPDDRPCRAPGGGGHDGPVAGRRRHPGAGRERGGGGAAGARPARLHHADDAVGGRHRGDRRHPAHALPRHRGAEAGGHLLRHHQPPGGGEGGGAGLRPGDRDRQPELLQLAAAARGGGAGRAPSAPCWSRARGTWTGP